jgi:hypothetical protein
MTLPPGPTFPGAVTGGGRLASGFGAGGAESLMAAGCVGDWLVVCACACAASPPPNAIMTARWVIRGTPRRPMDITSSLSDRVLRSVRYCINCASPRLGIRVISPGLVPKVTVTRPNSRHKPHLARPVRLQPRVLVRSPQISQPAFAAASRKPATIRSSLRLIVRREVEALRSRPHAIRRLRQCQEELGRSGETTRKIAAGASVGNRRPVLTAGRCTIPPPIS